MSFARQGSRRLGSTALLVGLVCAGPAALAAATQPASHLETWQTLQAAIEADEHERVVELASELVERQPEDAAVWYALGRSAFALERHEQAIAASQRAWDLGYRYMPWIALRIARSSASLGRDDAAFQWLERALDQGLEDRQSLAEYEEFSRLGSDPRFLALAGLARPEDRLEGQAADVDHLVTEARRLHPAYPRRAARFEAAAEELKRRLPQLDDRRLVFDLMRLVALLADGHSVVYGPLEDSPLEVGGGALPVKLYLFEEGLFVVDGVEAGESLIGRRIARIGRRTPQELLEHSRTLHGADNPMTMRWLAPQFYFPDASFLLDAGAIDDPGEVPLELVDDDGGSETIVLEAGDFQFPRKLRFAKAGPPSPPRYLRRVDTNYWFEVLDRHRAIYFQFNQVRDAEEEPIAAFAGRLGAALREPSIENLIIDLRHNNGGNNSLLRPLLREIVAFDTRPGSTTFVITGRNTFSAAQNFLNRLERWTDAVIVGEPSSSSPNFIGEETRVILPWSRVLVSISSRQWQESDPGDDRAWIVPQLPVRPRASDYFAGRDAALEAILDQISD